MRGEPLAFIMELPLYHLPHLRTIGLLVWQRCLSFVQRAGTLILVVSVHRVGAGWLPNGDIETSLLAHGRAALAPLGAAMGLDWRMMVALLDIVCGQGERRGHPGRAAGVGRAVGWRMPCRLLLTPAAALAFLVVQVLFVPCVATVAAIRQETGSWRWTLFSVALLLVISFSAGIAVYQIAAPDLGRSKPGTGAAGHGLARMAADRASNACCQ